MVHLINLKMCLKFSIMCKTQIYCTVVLFKTKEDKIIMFAVKLNNNAIKYDKSQQFNFFYNIIK